MGNSPVTGEFPAQKSSNAENVSIQWRHHAGKGHQLACPVLGKRSHLTGQSIGLFQQKCTFSVLNCEEETENISAYFRNTEMAQVVVNFSRERQWPVYVIVHIYIYIYNIYTYCPILDFSRERQCPVYLIVHTDLHIVLLLRNIPTGPQNG